MQINITTETTEEDPIPNPLVERDLWEQAFEPFEGEHYAALRLGFNFAMLRNYRRSTDQVSASDGVT
jgi:hypothetical protein